MSKATFYRWFNRFSEGNEQVEDEPRSGAPKNARKEENIQEVEKLVLKDRRSSVRMICETAGISVGTIDTTLTNDLKLHKVCAKFVPKILSRDQRQVRVECCTDIMQMIEADFKIYFKSLMVLLQEMLHSKVQWERCYHMWMILSGMRTSSQLSLDLTYIHYHKFFLIYPQIKDISFLQ